jgi:peptide/nickel transport system substrate-binding protein
VEDTNTNLAAVLAGEVDLCMRSTISFDGAMILREQWEKPGKGKVLISPASWTWLSLSRDNPIFSDVRVRRALLHAIDRDAMVQNLFKGEKVVSDLPLSRVRKSYKKALAASTVYKYDSERAKKLLAEAGWKAGADGVLTNAKGERMEFEFRVTAERRDHEQAQAVIDRNRWPGAYIGSHNVTVEEWHERFHSKNIPTAENKYAPENVSGWNDPKKDAILDELSSIITPARSEQLQIEFCKMFSAALPHLPWSFCVSVFGSHGEHVSRTRSRKGRSLIAGTDG